METHVTPQQAKEEIVKAREILIVTHEKPGFDSIGSSLTLYLALTGLGKKVTVACPDPMTVGLSNFVGANKIVTDVSRKNFIISLDYVDGSIEKVSYNIEGNMFNLVIEPRPGFDTFNPDKVHYSYAGASADLIICVDTIHLGGLGKLYENNKDTFSSRPILNIDWHPNNTHFGQYNLVDHSAVTTAEIVWTLIAQLGIALTADMATNVINSLYGATDNFTAPNLTARVFEIAAACVKSGGKRFVQSAQVQMSAGIVSSKPTVAVNVAKQVPQTAAVQAPVQPVAPSQKATESTTGAPADWLKPKIFKSSSTV